MKDREIRCYLIINNPGLSYFIGEYTVECGQGFLNNVCITFLDPLNGKFTLFNINPAKSGLKNSVAPLKITDSLLQLLDIDNSQLVDKYKEMLGNIELKSNDKINEGVTKNSMDNVTPFK